jgi:dihydrofolate reductase
VICDISMSLDGFIAGPNPTLEQPLGEAAKAPRVGHRAGELARASRRGRRRGRPQRRRMKESLAAQGAVVMGRRMFSGGAGPWEDDPNADGWWGDDPPFRVPVFILTHRAREPATKQRGTTFTFVTDGIEAALEQARAAAGDRDVLVAGGADAVQQYLRAGLFDELQIHLVPVLLGGGVRLLDNLGGAKVGLELDRVVDSPAVTHLRYRIVK